MRVFALRQDGEFVLGELIDNNEKSFKLKRVKIYNVACTRKCQEFIGYKTSWHLFVFKDNKEWFLSLKESLLFLRKKIRSQIKDNQFLEN